MFRQDRHSSFDMGGYGDIGGCGDDAAVAELPSIPLHPLISFAFAPIRRPSMANETGHQGKFDRFDRGAVPLDGSLTRH
jgi:hypothetical protein